MNGFEWRVVGSDGLSAGIGVRGTRRRLKDNIARFLRKFQRFMRLCLRFKSALFRFESLFFGFERMFVVLIVVSNLNFALGAD